MKKLIIFDLDGTLADSRTGAARLNDPEHLPTAASADGEGPKKEGQL